MILYRFIPSLTYIKIYSSNWISLILKTGRNCWHLCIVNCDYLFVNPPLMATNCKLVRKLWMVCWAPKCPSAVKLNWWLTTHIYNKLAVLVRFAKLWKMTLGSGVCFEARSSGLLMNVPMNCSGCRHWTHVEVNYQWCFLLIQKANNNKTAN